MKDQEIKVLNSVTKTLIDSRRGYEACLDAVNDDAALATELGRRRKDRATITADFQAQVRELGGEPAMDGSAVGAVHRAFSRFSSLFQDDQKAAIGALDDGEEYLAEKLEDCIEYASLSASSQVLMRRALQSARDGERFADALDD